MAHPADEHHRAGREWCYYIPPDGYVEGFGWRVSMVFDGVTGHIPIGVHPWEPGPDRLPMFWGHDYAAACALAEEQNENLHEDAAQLKRAGDARAEAARERCKRKVARMVERSISE